MMEVPAGRKNRTETLNLVREWVKRHAGEIEEALKLGYSWKQITQACVKEWQLLDIFEGVYLRKRETLVSDSYYLVRSGK